MFIYQSVFITNLSIVNENNIMTLQEVGSFSKLNIFTSTHLKLLITLVYVVGLRPVAWSGFWLEFRPGQEYLPILSVVFKQAGIFAFG